ncbi:MAG: glycosyltransferase family 2 protein [Bacteroidota bacterium]
MNRLPLISICIPTYNGEKYLKECLNSVLSQTYKNIEIIIVDDCSTDATTAILENYMAEDRRIILYKNTSNLGLVGNWNKCLELAKGEWIKFVFQDDLIVHDCIEKQQKAVKEHFFVVCDREFIFDNSVSETVKEYYNRHLLTLKKLVNTKNTVYLTDLQISKYAAENISLNFFGEPTAVMFKTEIIKEIGIFNLELSQICDLEYWLRIATLKGAVYIPETLVSFRIHAQSTTSNNILSTVKFKPRYIDTLLLAHEMLFSPYYVQFRSLMNFSYKEKLNYFIKSKMYEAKLAFEKDKSVDRDFFNGLFNKYPTLNNYYYPSFLTKIIFNIVIFRRKLKAIKKRV